MKMLLINGGQKFFDEGGKLNATLHEVAIKILKKQGHDIKETIVDTGWDNEKEVEKMLWADVSIYQMPGWWMGYPWKMTRYIDEVLSTGAGRIFKNDGRSHVNPSKNYGTGGLMKGKKYMLSVTWNAPLAAFNEEGEFFEGKGVDEVYLPFHKIQQFIGCDQGLPTFMVNDVVKAPHVDQFIAQYEAHLTRLFA